MSEIKRILGIEAGNGFFIYPFLNKGLIGNVESRSIFKTPKDSQWKSNFKKLPNDRILERDWGTVDMIIGHPDCGHSSVLAYSRAKKLSPPKENKSLQNYLRALKKYQPNIFVMENLEKTLVQFPELETWLLKKYDLIKLTGSVSQFSNSQKSRKRLILVGLKRSSGIPLVNLKRIINNLLIKYKNKPLATCGELMKDLPENGNRRELEPYTIPLYYNGARKMGVEAARKLWTTKYKDKRRILINLPRMAYQPGVYRNLDSDFPKTVRKSINQFDGNGEQLTPRQIARIQGAPDYFHLYENDDPAKYKYYINKARVTCAKTGPMNIGYFIQEVITKLNKCISVK